VLDPSGYIPSVVRASAEALADSTAHYLFVSTVSVYASLAAPVDEESPVAELGDSPDDRLAEDYSNYGPLKALCEQVVADVFAERQASVRPGLIVGANDPTGRFTYWPHRVARGSEVLAPAPPEAQVQFIDAKDLGVWLVDLSERRAGGVYNATHPGRSWSEVLETCREVSGSDAAFEWVRSTSTRSASGWSCRSGSPTPTPPRCTRWTSPARSPRASPSARSRRRCATRSSTQRPSRASG